MRVSASIVIFRPDIDELTRCLECVVASGIQDIWIIDNSPEPTPVDDIENNFHHSGVNIRYRHLPHNPGYGAAHNVALREAIEEGFEAHLVLNSDIQFDPEAIARLTAVMDGDDTIGQISPKIVSPDGQQQFSQRLLPTPLDVFGRRFLPSFIMRGRNRRYMLTERADVPADIPYHQGSFILFRTKALREVGLFDERYFMYPEDIDITRRVHKRYVTLYYPGATVIHAHRAASYRSLRMLRVHCRNMIRYFNKWGWWFDCERREVNAHTLDAMGLDAKGRKKLP